MKAIVINGLARGGTNLLCNLCAAQNNWHGSDLIIPEFLAVPYILDTDYFIQYPKKKSINSFYFILNKNLIKLIKILTEQFHKNLFPSEYSIQTSYHKDYTKYFNIPFDLWGDFLQKIRNIHNFLDIDDNYFEFFSRLPYKYLFCRTTAMTSYVEFFLSRSSNYFWIEIIRDPFDRAYSSILGHGLQYEESFLQSKWQKSHIDKIKNPNFIVVTYESLCENPKLVLDEIIKKINPHEVRIDFNTKPITPDGMPFSGNSSKNEKIFQQNVLHAGVYKTSLNSKSNLSKKIIKIGQKILSGKRPYSYYLRILISDSIFGFSKCIQTLSLLPFIFRISNKKYYKNEKFLTSIYNRQSKYEKLLKFKIKEFWKI